MAETKARAKKDIKEEIQYYKKGSPNYDLWTNR